MSRWAIGIDLGGTAIKAALVSLQRGILLERSVPTETSSGPEGIVAQLAGVIGSIVAETPSGFHIDAFDGIGLGAPGAVDIATGKLSYPPNLPGWTTFPLRDALVRALEGSLPGSARVFIENDANAAALGEAVYGAGRHFSDFLMVTLGTGVGGGIVLDRKLYRGPNGTAGEIGFMIVDYQGSSVHAGIRGTIEGMLGKEHIVEYARARIKENPESGRMLSGLCMHDFGKLSPRHIERAANEGDPLSLAVWERVGLVLGVGFANVTALMDIRKFVIGGGISAAGTLFFEQARQVLLRSTLPSMHAGIELVPAELGNRAGMHGAAALCFQ
ncbi:MAG: ROK family protein [Chlorobiaceae bacterium]|nr:ROK family protein [Chlorobiaceae bacterium]